MVFTGVKRVVRFFVWFLLSYVIFTGTPDTAVPDQKIPAHDGGGLLSSINFGRSMLFSDERAADRTNVVSIIREVMGDFIKNQQDIEYLWRYYRGDQPILRRTKKVRPEICNKVVENHAYEFVTFKKGYLLSEPIQYTRRKTSEDGESSGDSIAALNDIMINIEKSACDGDLAEWNHICGAAYRYCKGSEKYGIEVGSCDPRNTAVVYSRASTREPILAFQQIERVNRDTLWEVWTDASHFLIERERIVEESPNVLGFIPITEYPLNNARLGAFEPVISIFDAINNTSSNRLDGIEQFVQSFMKFVNCKIDDEKYDELREKGALYFTSDPGCPADVDIITSELDQTQTQVEITHLYQQALIIAGMPDRNGNGRTTGDTGQAVIMRDGWAAAEACARDTVTQWERSERRFLRGALKILREKRILDLDVSDINIKFTRSNNDNLLVKTQALQNLLEAGVHPEEAFKRSGVFADPNQAYINSEKYLKKWEFSEANVTPGNNKPNPSEGGEVQNAT